jgi:hypothetical protein
VCKNSAVRWYLNTAGWTDTDMPLKHAISVHPLYKDSAAAGCGIIIIIIIIIIISNIINNNNSNV